MKTLNEVISTMEFEAQYNNGEQRSYDADALHYLKEYREKHDEILRMEEALGYCEIMANQPLTWEELKQMFHSPVWIETTAKKGWNIIVSIDSADMQVIHTAHRGPKLSGFSKADLGKTWQAYRKERE